jgi:hypothetical protein
MVMSISVALHERDQYASIPSSINIAVIDAAERCKAIRLNPPRGNSSGCASFGVDEKKAFHTRTGSAANHTLSSGASCLWSDGLLALAGTTESRPVEGRESDAAFRKGPQPGILDLMGVGERLDAGPAGAPFLAHENFSSGSSKS